MAHEGPREEPWGGTRGAWQAPCSGVEPLEGEWRSRVKRVLTVVAVFLAATAEAQPDAVRMSSEAPRPAPALWVAPLFSLTLTPFAASQGSTLLMVPVGVNLPVSATREWVLELAPLFSHTRCEEAPCPAFGLSLSRAWPGRSCRMARAGACSSNPSWWDCRAGSVEINGRPPGPSSRWGSTWATA